MSGLVPIPHLMPRRQSDPFVGLIGGKELSTKEPAWALSENSVVGTRASVFSPGKDDEAGDVGFIADVAGSSQA